MSIPTSVLVVSLVAFWLIVLVPMVARRREHVPDTEESSKHFRVLRRASASLKRRRPSFRRDEAELEDEYDADEELTSDDDLEEVLLDNEHDIELAEDVEPEPDPSRRERVLVKQSRSVRVSARQQELSAEQDEVAEYDRLEYESVEYDRAEVRTDERADDGDREYAAADRYDEADHYEEDDPRYRPIPRRHGRGGYDPEAAEATRAYKYSRRRKVTLVLLLVTLAFSAAAYLLMPVLWAGTAVFGTLLVAYLTYLRRQVMIEEDIRQRRMARLRRARQIRPEYGRLHEEEAHSPYRPVEEPTEVIAAVPVPQVGRGRRRLVEFDDDDPVFDELEYYEPVTYRRAAGQ